jgi:hypothetical protein
MNIIIVLGLGAAVLGTIEVARKKLSFDGCRALLEADAERLTGVPTYQRSDNEVSQCVTALKDAQGALLLTVRMNQARPAWSAKEMFPGHGAGQFDGRTFFGRDFIRAESIAGLGDEAMLVDLGKEWLLIGRLGECGVFEVTVSPTHLRRPVAPPELVNLLRSQMSTIDRFLCHR